MTTFTISYHSSIFADPQIAHTIAKELYLMLLPFVNASIKGIGLTTNTLCFKEAAGEQWRSYERDLAELSQEVPNTLFVLEGNPENDLPWEIYFRDGEFRYSRLMNPLAL